jgi:hypothetical protein
MPDETSSFYKLDNYFDQFDRPFVNDHKRVEFPNNVTLFVYKTVSQRAAQAKSNEFYQTYSAPRDGEIRAARVDYWSKVALGAVAPPRRCCPC